MRNRTSQDSLHQPDGVKRPKKDPLDSDRYFAQMRFVAILGMVSSTTLSTFLFLASAFHVLSIIVEHVPHIHKKETVHHLVLASVEHADTMLIATALMIIGFGLYGLFVDAMDSLPKWLRISTIDELKSKLIGVVVVALGVHFFALAYEHAHQESLLVVGAAVGLVILALALYSWVHSQHHSSD